MEIAAFMVSIVALLLSIWAIWNARWAATLAGRSTRARRERAGAGRPKPHFRLDHVSRHRYILHNDGTRSAYDVRVETGELSVHEGSLTFDEFLPGQAEEYLLIQPLQGRMSEIVVTWHKQPDSLDEPRFVRLPISTHVVAFPEDQGT